MTILKYYDETDSTWKPFVNNANDAVTLSGDQTIAGKKTFTEDVDVDGDIYSNGKKVATDDGWWEELGRTTLSGSSTSVSITQKKYMKILVSGRSSGSTGTVSLRTNSHTYDVIISNMGATYTGAESTNVTYFWNMGLTTGQNFTAESNIGTVSSNAVYSTVGTTGGANRMVGAVNRSTGAITSVNISVSTGTLSGEMVVLGHD